VQASRLPLEAGGTVTGHEVLPLIRTRSSAARPAFRYSGLRPSPRSSRPMPRAIPVPVRRQVLTLAGQGRSTSAIAAALGLPPRTVRSFLRRDPAAVLAIPYQRPSPPRP